MTLVVDPDACREIYAEAGRTGAVVPMFGTENQATTEAILAGARAYALARGGPVTIGIGFTARYAGRNQLARYSSIPDTREGFLAARDDLMRLCRDDGPFPEVDVIAHLDHGQPGPDDDLFDEGADLFGVVMCDGSELPLAENAAVTRDYVERYGARYLIEGCVDKIAASGSGAPNAGLAADEVAGFMETTGVDLVAADLGTEHRAAASDLSYRQDTARRLAAAVGPRLVLHGSSSLRPEERATLGADGVVKLNIWTLLERVGSRAATHAVLGELGRVLPRTDIESLVERDVLTAGFAESQRERRQQVDYFADCWRREHWAVAVAEAVRESADACLGQGGRA